MKKYNHFFLSLLCFVSFCFLIIGCSSGGGSSGTGGLRIQGVVVDPQTSKPISKTSVSISQTGDTATTDQNGNFVIDTDPLSGDIELIVENNTATSRTSLKNIPAETESVTCRLEFDERNKKTEVKDISITKKPRAEATKTPRPSPTPKSTIDNNDDDNSGGNDDGSSGGNGNNDGDDDSGNGSGNGNGNNNGGGSGNGNGGQEQEVEVTSNITALTSSSATVGGYVFTIDSETDFGNRDSLSEFSVGERVEAKGKYQGQILIADKIKLKN
jgi:hypothetical protein